VHTFNVMGAILPGLLVALNNDQNDIKSITVGFDYSELYIAKYK